MNLKLVQIHVHFEYTDAIDVLLEHAGVRQFVRYPLMEGKDHEGRHHGTQIFPGNLTVFQAIVPEADVDRLFADLEHFRTEKRAHEHLQALVLPVERQLGTDAAAAATQRRGHEGR
ncbi:MAG: PG0541 family transporter-associated protein [Phycisphaeraceae bacterium]